MAHSKAWHEMRKTGIGGSDAPLIMLGELYGRTVADLWREKVGETEPEDLSDNPDVQRGVALEPIARASLARELGVEIVEPGSMRDINNDWMIGNVDGLVPAVTGNPAAVLEIKCPRSYALARIAEEGIPAHYQIQIQHYLAITGCTMAYLAVWDLNNWRNEVFIVERNSAFIKLLIEKEQAFWDSVKENRCPEITIGIVDLPNVGKTSLKSSEIDTDLVEKVEHYITQNSKLQASKKQLDIVKEMITDAWPSIDGEQAKSLIVDAGKVTLSKTKNGYSLRATRRDQ